MTNASGHEYPVPAVDSENEVPVPTSDERLADLMESTQDIVSPLVEHIASITAQEHVLVRWGLRRHLVSRFDVDMYDVTKESLEELFSLAVKNAYRTGYRDHKEEQPGATTEEVPQSKSGEVTVDAHADASLAQTAGRIGLDSIMGLRLRRDGFSLTAATEIGLPASRKTAELLIAALRETGHLTGDIDIEQVSEVMKASRQGEL